MQRLGLAYYAINAMMGNMISKYNFVIHLFQFNFVIVYIVKYI